MPAVNHNVRIEGLDSAFNDLKRLFDETTARKIVLSSLRNAIKAGGGLRAVERLTPIGDYPHISTRRDEDGNGNIIDSGNLRDSVKMFAGRSKDFPNMQVGFQTGSNNRGGKPDGWYGYFVNEGFGQGNRRPRKIFETALNETEPAIARAFEIKLIQSVQRRKRKYGFR